MKQCNKCLEVKDEGQFYRAPGHSDGFDSACKACCLERHRLRFRFQRYGVSYQDFEAMVTSQAGRCAICQEVPNRTLCIDHNHATKAVRKLLCHSCNKGLGHFKDSADIVLAAATYLETENGK